MLETIAVSKSFGTRSRSVNAVRDVTMSIVTVSLSQSSAEAAAEKSTLMNLLGALDFPTNGSIFVDREDITQLSAGELVRIRQRKIGFVFQNFNLISNLTAVENVMLPMECVGVLKAERRSRAMDLLEKVELAGDSPHRKPSHLSGGEQQRVAIARALANKPSFVLADEPAGNLDSQTSSTVISLLWNLTRTEGTTVVIVTHDMTIAKGTDRILRIDDGRLSEND